MITSYGNLAILDIRNCHVHIKEKESIQEAEKKLRCRSLYSDSKEKFDRGGKGDER